MSTSLPLRILSLLLAVGTPLAFSACGEKEEMVASPGAVKGEVYPAGAVSKVVATSSTGQNYEFVPTSQTAAFQLDELPAGDYVLTFTTTASYNSILPQQVTIRAGQTTVVPAITAFSSGRSTGEMSWTLDGQRYSTTKLSGGVENNFFSLIGLLQPGPGNGYEEVSLIVPGLSGMPYPFQGVGTYPLGLSEWTMGRYIQKPDNGIAVTYSSYLLGASAGSVTITELDPVARKAAGTFSFTAGPWLNATGTRQITNGSFRFSY